MRQTIETSLSSFETELKVEPNTLRFESHNDDLDYADKLIEDCNRRISVNKYNIANRYMAGDVEMCIVFTLEGLAKKFHFVFRSIPNRSLEITPASLAVSYDLSEYSVTSIDGNGGDERVFIGVTEGVQSPEQIIPSFVWLEPANKALDVGRQGIASPFDGVMKIGGRI